MKRAGQSTETPQVGRSIPRLESWLKVTGRAEYVHNLRLPGMLYGKIWRSTVAHGRIKRIDAPRRSRRRAPRGHGRRHPQAGS
jgi:CO/xanthine dehydrogenase Mo-binding subunit